jgi:hypothetical protein
MRKKNIVKVNAKENIAERTAAFRIKMKIQSEIKELTSPCLATLFGSFVDMKQFIKMASLYFIC